MAPIAIATRSRFSGLTSLDTTLSSSKMVEGSTNWFVDRHLLIHTVLMATHRSIHARVTVGELFHTDTGTTHTHPHTHTHTLQEINKGAVRYSTWTCVH